MRELVAIRTVGSIRPIPDFERRKIWLAEHGMDVEGL